MRMLPMLSINVLEFQLHQKTDMLLQSGELEDNWLVPGSHPSLHSFHCSADTVLLEIGSHLLELRILILPDLICCLHLTLGSQYTD